MTDALAINLEASCWLVKGYPDGVGYGRVKVNGKTVSTHRYMWTMLRGPIPTGLTVDHLCRVRNCVNPQHMELVTLKENILRGEGASARHAHKTHCPQGHLYAGDNLRFEKGPRGGLQRRCRACHRLTERSRRYKSVE